MQCVCAPTTRMSKLKRKKLSVEEKRSEQQSRIRKSNDGQCAVTLQESSCSSTFTGRERWWESSELNDAERLWALTLRALCPNLQSDQEESIPQLPPPSSTKTPVQKVSDWRWSSADEDVNPPPQLSAPSFLIHPPPANDFKKPSQPPAAENIGKSDPPAFSEQENHGPSPDQESVPVCVTETAHQRHPEDKVNCVEGRELLDKQINSQAGNISESRECGAEAELKARGSGARKGAKTGAGQSELGLETKPGLRLGAKSGLAGSVSGQGTNSEESGTGLGQRTKSGAGQEAKSGLGGSVSGFVTNSLASGSGLGVRAKSGAALGVKSGLAGSVSGLATHSEAGGSGLVAKTKSATGQKAKSGLQANLGTNQSGLGQRTKSGAGQEAKSDLGGSVSGLGTNSGACGSGSGQGAKRDPERSGSGLECCPMCLMPFPAGFTQMECDGHLAQCLSEMQDDIIW